MTDEAKAFAQTADRLDELAETAELMGDDAGAVRLRQRAERLRLGAMARLDESAD